VTNYLNGGTKDDFGASFHVCDSAADAASQSWYEASMHCALAAPSQDRMSAHWQGTVGSISQSAQASVVA